MSGQDQIGRLFIIGGGEDREQEKTVLKRFITLCGGPSASVIVITAASTVPDEMWAVYDAAFGDLGVQRRGTFRINSREEANDPAKAKRLRECDGIFLTGGDQKRLLALIGGTAIDDAIHHAFRHHGTCVAGTSAGASALSEHMLSESRQTLTPQKGTAHLAAGLGFLQRVVIDQHFSERQRLVRLLGIVAQNPYLLGVGIDEDTGLLISPGSGVEVVGDGSVTIVDGRRMLSNYLEIDRREQLELINVQLHLLPAGARYHLDAGGPDDAQRVPAPLREVLRILTAIQPAPLVAEPLAEPN
jgi:cyanophycinase